MMVWQVTNFIFENDIGQPKLLQRKKSSTFAVCISEVSLQVPQRKYTAAKVVSDAYHFS
jgi:hypothetical protein